MEHSHIMINLSVKGGITSIHRNVTYHCFSGKDQRPVSPESDHHNATSMEVQNEDQVNPRGSRDRRSAVYFGLG